MESVVESLEKAAAVGIKCAQSTFWKYRSLGLLKKGKKIRGRGNALYVADDTHLRIRLIQLLNENLGIPLDELSEFLKGYTGNCADLLPPRPLSTGDKKAVEEEYCALKKQALSQLIKRLPELLPSQHGAAVAKRKGAQQPPTTTAMRRLREISLETPTDDYEHRDSVRKPRDILSD